LRANPCHSRRRRSCRRRASARLALGCVGLFALASGLGCLGPNQIDIDIEKDQPTFFVYAPIWTWNMKPVRINALAVASEDEAYWEIRTLTPDGVPAAGLEIHYGELPEDFEQITPANNGRAKDLVPGETCFVGATGPNDETWRAIFALPVSRYGAPPKRDFEPDETPAKIDVTTPKPAARIAD